MNYETIRGYGIGAWIAFIILIICIVMLVNGKPVSGELVVWLIGGLALSRLL